MHTWENCGLFYSRQRPWEAAADERELQWLSKEETQLSFLFPRTMTEMGVMHQSSTP